jgi:hypothetical protein
MTARGYVPNPDFEDEWHASSEALELVKGIAEEAAPIAESLAPERTGNLADSIEAQAGVVDGKATGRVVAKDFKAGWWEFGHEGKDQPFLRPAMETVTGSPVKGERS